MIKEVFLVVCTWPDGMQTLLFPKPGRKPICQSPNLAIDDFDTAVEHLKQYHEASHQALREQYTIGCKLELVVFNAVAVIKEFTNPPTP